MQSPKRAARRRALNVEPPASGESLPAVGLLMISLAVCMTPGTATAATPAPSP